MVGRQRQGWAIFAAMPTSSRLHRVSSPRPSGTGRRPSTPPASAPPFDGSTGGNLEGKEQRNGIAVGALGGDHHGHLHGSVNSALDSLTGLGGLVPFSSLATSEVVFGGVGTGTYSMLLFVLLAVFIGGLMVGPRPSTWARRSARARSSSSRWACWSPR